MIEWYIHTYIHAHIHVAGTYKRWGIIVDIPDNNVDFDSTGQAKCVPSYHLKLQDWIAKTLKSIILLLK